MAKAPLPDTLPGKFFVVEYGEFTEEVVVIVDDGQMSSYRLGPPMLAHHQLTIWGVDSLLASRAIDYAKEFKAPVQCIPSKNRTISLRERCDTQELVFPEETKNNWLHNV
jgi:hypothetical protein